MKVHWTQRTIRAFLIRIAADFIAQLEKKMEAENVTQDELAKRLKITKGRVSQVLNHPGNISLSILAKYARALGMKLSILAYEDGDPQNIKGPINSEIFKICWEDCGKPGDFWELQETKESKQEAARVEDTVWRFDTPLEKGLQIPEFVSAASQTLQMYPFKGSVLAAGEILPSDPGTFTATRGSALPVC